VKRNLAKREKGNALKKGIKKGEQRNCAGTKGGNEDQTNCRLGGTLTNAEARKFWGRRGKLELEEAISAE